jgi:archaellum biogenesis ATPase FlaH
MNEIKFDNIPQALRDKPQWVFWKIVDRGGEPTKVPYAFNHSEAKSNDSETWAPFDDIASEYQPARYNGVGFVFENHGGLVGVDLDGCREPETGKVADWAREIILKLNSYAEVSPSKTGVKIFLRGKSPFDTGKRLNVTDAPKVCGKTPAIEIYDKLRYFAVTGWRVQGPHEPQLNAEAIMWLKEKYWSNAPEGSAPAGNFYSDGAIIERARKYLFRLPAAVSGQKGHDSCFRAACVLVLGFGLARSDAMMLMREYSQGCTPPWSDRELEHKVDSASKQPGERNYLRQATPERWDSIAIPEYKSPRPVPEKRVTTLADAARQYLDTIKQGKETLIDLGISDLDYALGGGVEPGEMVIIAARPSHGKSAVALQCVHHWTGEGRKVLVVSEEMSALALGKRTLQFISDVPQEHWRTSLPEVERELEEYASTHERAIVLESCRTSHTVADEIDKAVSEHGITAAVIDYAQLLKSPGKTRYEEITNTSVLLRQVASQHKIVLMVLCQLNRQVEGRNKFVPLISDLKDTGQLEQDADVITLLCWPHRLDSSRDPHEFIFFIGKNRNRPINQPAVTCRFEPSRQRILMPKAKDMPNYDQSFNHWNDREPAQSEIW